MPFDVEEFATYLKSFKPPTAPPQPSVAPTQPRVVVAPPQVTAPSVPQPGWSVPKTGWGSKFVPGFKNPPTTSYALPVGINPATGGQWAPPIQQQPLYQPLGTVNWEKKYVPSPQRMSYSERWGPPDLTKPAVEPPKPTPTPNVRGVSGEWGQFNMSPQEAERAAIYQQGVRELEDYVGLSGLIENLPDWLRRPTQAASERGRNMLAQAMQRTTEHAAQGDYEPWTEHPIHNIGQLRINALPATPVGEAFQPGRVISALGWATWDLLSMGSEGMEQALSYNYFDSKFLPLRTTLGVGNDPTKEKAYQAALTVAWSGPAAVANAYMDAYELAKRGLLTPENIEALQAKHGRPWKEMFGHMVADPLWLLDIAKIGMTPMRAARGGRWFRGAENFFLRPAVDETGALMKGSRVISELFRAADRGAQIASTKLSGGGRLETLVKTGIDVAFPRLKGTVVHMEATRMAQVVEMTSGILRKHAVLEAVENGLKASDALFERFVDIRSGEKLQQWAAAMVRTASDNIDDVSVAIQEMNDLAGVGRIGASRVGRRTGVILKALMEKETGELGDIHEIIQLAKQEGKTAEYVASAFYTKASKVLRGMIAEPKFERAPLQRAVKGMPLIGLDSKFRKAVDEFYSTILLGQSPGYAMRNLFDNFAHTVANGLTPFKANRAYWKEMGYVPLVRSRGIGQAGELGKVSALKPMTKAAQWIESNFSEAVYDQTYLSSLDAVLDEGMKSLYKRIDNTLYNVIKGRMMRGADALEELGERIVKLDNWREIHPTTLEAINKINPAMTTHITELFGKAKSPEQALGGLQVMRQQILALLANNTDAAKNPGTVLGTLNGQVVDMMADAGRFSISSIGDLAKTLSGREESIRISRNRAFISAANRFDAVQAFGYLKKIEDRYVETVRHIQQRQMVDYVRMLSGELTPQGFIKGLTKLYDDAYLKLDHSYGEIIKSAGARAPITVLDERAADRVLQWALAREADMSGYADLAVELPHGPPHTIEFLPFHPRVPNFITKPDPHFMNKVRKILLDEAEGAAKQALPEYKVELKATLKKPTQLSREQLLTVINSLQRERLGADAEATNLYALVADYNKILTDPEEALKHPYAQLLRSLEAQPGVWGDDIFAIISGDNPMLPGATEGLSTKLLKEEFAGHHIEDLIGYYGGATEESAKIHGVSLLKAKEAAKKYGQESFIWVKGDDVYLVDTKTGKANKASLAKTKFFGEAPEADYSYNATTKQYYSYDFDWDNTYDVVTEYKNTLGAELSKIPPAQRSQILQWETLREAILNGFPPGAVEDLPTKAEDFAQTRTFMNLVDDIITEMYSPVQTLDELDVEAGVMQRLVRAGYQTIDEVPHDELFNVVNALRERRGAQAYRNFDDLMRRYDSLPSAALTDDYVRNLHGALPTGVDLDMLDELIDTHPDQAVKRAAIAAKRSFIAAPAQSPALTDSAFEQSARELELIDGLLEHIMQTSGHMEKPGLPREFMTELRAIYANAHIVASEVATRARNHALLDYNDRRTVDVGLKFLFPWHYWWSRSIPNWLHTMATNPRLAAHYMRFRNELAEYNQQDKSVPDWAKQTLVIQPPGYPGRLMWDYGAAFNAIGTIFDNFDDEDQTKDILGKLIKMSNSFGPAPHPMFVAAYAAERWFLNHDEAAARSYGHLAPITRAYSAITGQVVEPWMWITDEEGRRIPGVGGTKWDIEKANRLMAERQKQGEISGETAVLETALRKGPSYQDTLMNRIVRGYRTIPAIASSLFGLRIGVRQDWENELVLDNNQYWDARETGDDQKAIEILNDKPWISTLWLSWDNEATRMKILSDNVLYRLPAMTSQQRNEILGAAGITPELEERFWNETEEDRGAMASWDREDYDTFVRGIVDLANIFAIPDKETAREYRIARKERREIVEKLNQKYPEHSTNQATYFALKETGNDEAAEKLLETTSLRQSWAYKNKLFTERPYALKYYGDTVDVDMHINSLIHNELVRRYGSDIFSLRQRQKELEGYDEKREFRNLYPYVGESYDIEEQLLIQYQKMFEPLRELAQTGLQARVPEYQENFEALSSRQIAVAQAVDQMNLEASLPAPAQREWKETFTPEEVQVFKANDEIYAQVKQRYPDYYDLKTEYQRIKFVYGAEAAKVYGKESGYFDALSYESLLEANNPITLQAMRDEDIEYAASALKNYHAQKMWPGIFDTWTAYFEIPKGKARKQFWKEHPELGAYMDWTEGADEYYNNLILQRRSELRMREAPPSEVGPVVRPTTPPEIPAQPVGGTQGEVQAQRVGRTVPGVQAPLNFEALAEAIGQEESGGDYEAQNPKSTASGKYQYIDSTWDNYGGYEKAKEAPPEVQDEKMLGDLQARASKYDNDIEKMIAAHYYPAWANKPEMWDKAPRKGQPTMRAYINRVLNILQGEG